MSKLIVAFDVDGVIKDFVGLVRTTLDLPPDWNPNQWDIELDPVVMARPYYKQSLDVLYKARGTESSIREYPDAAMLINTLREVCDEHVEVIFATSPMRCSETWMHERQRFLERRFPGAAVLHGSAKHHVDADMLLDDKPSNCIDFESKGRRPRNRMGVLLRRPWNAQCTALGLVKVETLEEFCAFVAGRCDMRDEYLTKVCERRAVGL